MTRNTLLLFAGFGILYWLARQRYPTYTGSHVAGLGEGSERLDVTQDEDLANLCCHLLGMEQHLASSSAQTGDTRYADALRGVRDMRRKLMAQMLPATAQGQDWCVVKHCLAASMHAREVGDKMLSSGLPSQAQGMYGDSQKLKDTALAVCAAARPGRQCRVCRGG